MVQCLTKNQRTFIWISFSTLYQYLSYLFKIKEAKRLYFMSKSQYFEEIMVFFKLMAGLNYFTSGAEILREITAGNMLSDGTNPNFQI